MSVPERDLDRSDPDSDRGIIYSNYYQIQYQSISKSIFKALAINIKLKHSCPNCKSANQIQSHTIKINSKINAHGSRSPHIGKTYHKAISNCNTHNISSSILSFYIYNLSSLMLTLALSQKPRQSFDYLQQTLEGFLSAHPILLFDVLNSNAHSRTHNNYSFHYKRFASWSTNSTSLNILTFYNCSQFVVFF